MRKKWKLGLGALCLAGALLFSTPMVSSASSDVNINASNFPDSAFRRCMSSRDYDMNQDGKLSQAEINRITNLQLPGNGIKNLKGIENFTNLRELNVNNNKLTSLDLKRNQNLIYLSCKNNQLKTLDLRSNTEIAGIDCQNNKLEHLYMPKLYQKTYYSSYTSINTKGNPNLRYVDLRDCIDALRSGGYYDFNYDPDTFDIWYSSELGFFAHNGKLYYIKDSGDYPDTIQFATGWKDYAGQRYYFRKSNGAAVTGKVKINSRYYYFSDKNASYGELQTGWINIKSQKYYAAKTGKGVLKGALQSGKVKVGSYYYFFSKKASIYGRACVGLIKDGSKTYFAQKTGKKKGVLLTGKVKVGKKYFYFSKTAKTYGEMQVGKIKIGKMYYYFSKAAKTYGEMQTGLIKVGKKKFYATKAGVLKTGMIKIKGKTYYFNPKAASYGQQKTGWVKIGKKSYYFSPKAKTLGQMVTGKLKIGKKVYKFNKSGVCLNR